MSDTQPNILFLCSDQHHHTCLGAVNDRIQTPALDRLCNEGVRFERAYCTNPTCTPCRASMITGMYPSQHQAWSLGTKLFEDVPTVGDHLQHAGYATALIGKAHFQPLASKPGMESLECQPTLRDLDFWRTFHGPWYGFEHVEVARNHTWESHAGQHYGIWMEERGLPNWRDHFAKFPREKDDQARLHSQRHWELPEPFHYTRWTGERARAFIERAVTADRPFFAMVNFHDPHPPYSVSEPWASMYDPDEMVPGELTPGEHDRNPIHFRMTQEEHPKFREMFWEDQGIHGAHSHLHDREELKKDMAVYYGMVSFFDDEIGKILDDLDRLGVADNTLVVFTTDHGHFLGQHGLTAKAIHHYEDLIRIPFIVRWPGRTPAGEVSQAIQNTVDLSPTFLAAAGLDVPGIMTGANQLDTWTGGDPARSWSITENRHTLTNFHMHSYVNQRYK
ncbi:sulfatase-like hydrolase/transferase, partial [bacterium]|nr:sulfatase-like hydrolase/transferase [bacterium]